MGKLFWYYNDLNKICKIRNEKLSLGFMCIGIPYFAFLTTLVSEKISRGLRAIEACLGKLGNSSVVHNIYIFGGMMVLIFLPATIFSGVEG